MTFSEELKATREASGLTLQEAASLLLYVSDEEYGSWEAGAMIPPEAMQIIALSRLKNPPRKKTDTHEGSVLFVTTENVTADKCEVLHEFFMDYPLRVIVKSLLTGKTYSIYPEWHCHATEKDAIAASQKYREGHKDIIY